MIEFQYSKVHFYFLKKIDSLKNRTLLKEFILELAQLHKKEVENLNFIFCSDDYLLEINKSYLQHDYYTDIITFDLSDSKKINGEIYISIDRVIDNANTFKTTIKNELHRVIFHGILHLCGFKDKTKNESEKMREEEQKALNRYFS